MTQALIDRTTRAFRDRFQAPPEHIFLAPGRINLIGEHVDYNDGPVLPAAIDKYICFAISATADTSAYSLAAIDLDEAITVPAEAALKPAPGRWSTYLLGVLHGIRSRGKSVGGFRVAFASNIPMGAGLSSSAALCSGFGFALDRLFGLGLSRKELALIGQRAEHDFAGVRCGIMDQFASLFGQEGKVIKLDCGTLEHSYVEASIGDHATIFTLDVYKEYLAKDATEARLVRMGKLSIVVAMVLAIVLAPFLGIDKKGGFQYIQEYTGFVSPGVFAMFLLGFFWKRTTANAALFAMIGGFLGSIVLKVLPQFMDLSFLYPIGFAVPNAEGIHEIPFIDRMGIVFGFCVLGMVLISIRETRRGIVPHGLEVDAGMFKVSRSFMVWSALLTGLLVALYAYFW